MSALPNHALKSFLLLIDPHCSSRLPEFPVSHCPQPSDTAMTRLRPADVRVGAVALIVACGLTGPSLAQQPPSVRPLPYRLSPYLPHDVFNPIPGATGTQSPMDYLSWQTFVALNWPASEVQNGQPDGNLMIGGQPIGGYYPNGMRSSPTVWETYKDSADIFLPGAKPPTPFSAKPRHVLYDMTESFTSSPLNDQNGRHVYYEVRMNEVEYNYIVSHKFYDSTKQKPPISFPPGNNATSEVGSIHVKAAWKILNLNGPGQHDDPARFYTAQALIYTPGVPSAFLATVGLVGLHIAHKTIGRPEWIWSTFEQVDNAPDMPQASAPIPAPPTPPGQYNFTNAGCNATQCPPNQQVAKTSDTPVQVLRVTPIPQETQNLNLQFQAALHEWNPKTVWQYYQLVSTQWPAEPANTKIFGGPQPAFLANTTLETYFQGPSPANPTSQNPPHSCMDCHGMFGQQKDFVFQLFKAHPHAATAAPPVPGFFDPPAPPR